MRMEGGLPCGWKGALHADGLFGTKPRVRASALRFRVPVVWRMRAEAAAGAASHPQTTATTTRTAINTSIRFFLFQFLRRQFGILFTIRMHIMKDDNKQGN